jgi:hypothetical protein
LAVSTFQREVIKKKEEGEEEENARKSKHAIC